MGLWTRQENKNPFFTEVIADLTYSQSYKKKQAYEYE
tara:strand:- start:153 stop:263 length:111 start_codon:yes stop_codon:yes gene_type:complete